MPPVTDSVAKKTFTADNSNAVKAIQELAGHYAKMQAEVEKLAKASKRSSEETIKGWKEVARAIKEAHRGAEDFSRTSRGGGGGMGIPTGMSAAEQASWMGGRDFLRAMSGTQAAMRGSFLRDAGRRVELAGLPSAESLMGNVNALTPALNAWAGSQGFRRVVDELAGGLERADQVLRRHFGNVIRDAGGLAVTFGSLATVITAVTEAVQRELDLQRGALEAHKSVAGGQAEIILNTFGMSNAERQRELFEPARQIAAETGLPETLIAQTLGRQMGRGVGLSNEQVRQSVGMAARIARHTPEQVRPLASLIQQIMRTGGLDVENAAGLAMSAAGAAYPDDPALQARFLAQSLSSGLANVKAPTAKSVEEVLELGAWISQAAGEERGEAGRTSVTAFLAQMTEFREGRGPWEIAGPMGTKLRPKRPDAPTDPLDFVAWLRANPVEARRFTDKMSFERQFEGIWRNLILDPTSREAGLFDATRGEVKPDVALLKRQIADIERGTPQLQVATADKQREARDALIKGQLTPEAITDSMRKERDRAIALAQKHRKEDWLTEFLVRKSSDFGGWLSPESQAQRYADQIEWAKKSVLQGNRFAPTTPDRLSPEQRQIYDRLSEMADTAKKQLEELKALRASQPSAAPAMNGQRGAHSER